MKISGTIVEALAKAEVPIPRTNGKDIVVVVRASRLAEENEAEKLFPDIEPARGYLKDDKGMPLRNPDTGEVGHGAQEFRRVLRGHPFGIEYRRVLIR